MIFDINQNKRVDFSLQKLFGVEPKRAVAIALPLLSLHSSTATMAALGAGGYQCYTLWNSEDPKKWRKLALFVSYTAMGVLVPRVQLALSSTVFFIRHFDNLLGSVNEGDLKKCGCTIWQLTSHIVYLASICYGTPGFLALSLIFQAIQELAQAIEYRKEKTPEMIASLLLASIRLHKAYSYLPSRNGPKHAEPLSTEVVQNDDSTQAISPHLGESSEKKPLKMQTELLSPNVVQNDGSTQPASPPLIMSSEKKPLKILTTEEWNNMSANCRGSSRFPLHLHALLVEQGFSTEVQNVDFTKGGCSLKHAIFSHLTFKNCRFKEERFKGSQFDHVVAEGCNFAKSDWTGVKITDSSFTGCQFTNASFFQAVLERVTFKQCRLDGAIFYEAVLNGLSVHQSTFAETNFLMATVSAGKLIDCDLTNTLLLDTKNSFEIVGGTPHQINKPVVALGWDFDETGPFTCLIRKALRDNGAIVLQYSQTRLPAAIVPAQLEQEVKIGIQNVKAGDPSISVQVMQNPALPEIQKVRQIARTILEHSQGLVLPGGDDIPAYFYNPLKLDQEESKSSICRTALEIALLVEAQRKKIPTMGICRGAQLINVFCGGTVSNLAKWKSGFQTMEWLFSPHGKEFQTYLQPDRVSAFSAHHQFIDKVGAGLHVLLKKGDIPKFLISEDGRLMASQIHPESYIEFKDKIVSKTLRIILNALLEAANMKQEKMALNSIATNKRIYKFFLEKVESYRKAEAALV